MCTQTLVYLPTHPCIHTERISLIRGKEDDICPPRTSQPHWFPHSPAPSSIYRKPTFERSEVQLVVKRTTDRKMEDTTSSKIFIQAIFFSLFSSHCFFPSLKLGCGALQSFTRL